MTNPNNAIGTNGAFDGRTSPNALNDLTAAFTRGIVNGWSCSPKSGMTVQLGGSASVRDVALAEDNAGDKLTINNRSGAPVEVTLAGAPATNNRVDVIVAYVDNPSTGDGNTTDNPTACGIVAVSGTVAANPTAPTDEQIRSAITADGATGGVAYYVILATIRVGTSVTSIGSGVITQGTPVQSIAALEDSAVTTEKIADGAVTSEKVDWTTIKFPAPDYSNGTSISSSANTWTAPKCGVVIAVLIADTTNGYKNATISVNDKLVASAMWAGATGGYNFQTRAIVPVATGDVVTFSATDGQSTVSGRVFYPYKWV